MIIQPLWAQVHTIHVPGSVRKKGSLTWTANHVSYLQHCSRDDTIWLVHTKVLIYEPRSKLLLYNLVSYIVPSQRVLTMTHVRFMSFGPTRKIDRSSCGCRAAPEECRLSAGLQDVRHLHCLQDKLFQVGRVMDFQWSRYYSICPNSFITPCIYIYTYLNTYPCTCRLGQHIDTETNFPYMSVYKYAYRHVDIHSFMPVSTYSKAHKHRYTCKGIHVFIHTYVRMYM